MKPQPNKDRIGVSEYGRIGETPHPAVTPTRRGALTPTQVILGIDPGLATTGWGVIEKTASSLRLLAFGAIVTPARQELPLRLLHIQGELSRLIETYRPGIVAIEELYFAKFAVSIASTAQARGAILLTVAQRGLSLVEYNPRAVKMAMTGFGSASKDQMQSMVQRYFALKELPRPDDAADALAIALCHAQTNQVLVGAGLVPARIANAPRGHPMEGYGGPAQGRPLHKL